MRIQMADTNTTFISRPVGQPFEMALISPGLVVFTVQHPYHQGIHLSISQQPLRGSKQGRQVITYDLPSTLLLPMIHKTYLDGRKTGKITLSKFLITFVMEGSDEYKIQLKPDIDDITMKTISTN